MAKKKVIKPAESTIKVLAFLQNLGAGVKTDCKTTQRELGFEKPGSITGSVTSLCNKGYAERFKEEVEDENGKVTTKSFFALTEKGANADLMADYEAALAAAEAE